MGIHTIGVQTIFNTYSHAVVYIVMLCRDGCRLFFLKGGGGNLGLHAKRGRPERPALGSMLKSLHDAWAKVHGVGWVGVPDPLKPPGSAPDMHPNNYVYLDITLFSRISTIEANF